MLNRTEVEEWITDVRSGCVPDGAVFVEVAERMLAAEGFWADTFAAAEAANRGEGKSWEQVCAELGMEVPAHA